MPSQGEKKRGKKFPSNSMYISRIEIIARISSFQSVQYDR